MARRPHIRQRRLAFIGCEGEGEVAYVALLNDLAKTRDGPVAFKPYRLNPGAGDPVQLVNRAIQLRKQKQAKGSQFKVSAVLLDKDRLGQLHQGGEELRRTALNAKLLLVLQDPDHEGFLLRHLRGCEFRRPSPGTSLRELQRRWPEYQKGQSTRIKLAEQIAFEDIERVCRVEPGLRELLTRIGFLKA